MTPLLPAIAAAVATVILCIWFGLPRRERLRAASPGFVERVVFVTDHFSPATIVLRRGTPGKVRFVSAPDTPVSEVSIGTMPPRKIVAGKITTVDVQFDERAVVTIQGSNGAAATILVIADGA